MKFLITFLITITLALIFWVLGVYAQLGKGTEDYRWVNEVYGKKDFIAVTQTSEKILLLAGSNLLFGVDSKMLSQYWNMPVVNYGVHAGLTIDYLLERSKRVLRKGDTVIVPLEYKYYLIDTLPSQMHTSYILGYDTRYFNHLSLQQKYYIITRLGIYRWFKGLSLSLGFHEELSKGVYDLKYLNEYGDQTSNTIDNIEPSRQILLDQIMPVTYQTTQLHTSFKVAMTEYFKWAKHNNICVLGMPPNYLYFEEYQDNSYTELVNNVVKFYERFGVRFIGVPEAYMFPEEFYFDTRYHLNNEGVALRTEQMIRDIGTNPKAYCDQVDSFYEEIIP